LELWRLSAGSFANRENGLRPFALIAALVPLTAGTGAIAQSYQDFQISNSEQTVSFDRPLSFRINEIVAPDGSRHQKRSIIAGVEVAPDTTVGIGLFDTMPKVKGTGGADPRLDARAKKSRKAAVGLSFRF
jgi:hypothetical protein